MPDTLTDRQIRRLMVIRRCLIENLSCDAADGFPCLKDREHATEAMLEWLTIHGYTVTKERE